MIERLGAAVESGRGGLLRIPTHPQLEDVMGLPSRLRNAVLPIPAKSAAPTDPATDPLEQRIIAQVGRRLLPLLFLLFIGGRERTEREYRALLDAAGMELRRIIPTESPLHLLEAFPNGASHRRVG